MAIYVSRYSRHRINMIPKSMGEQTIGKHKFETLLPGLSVQFRNAKPGFPTTAIPTAKDGTARGIFNTETDFPADHAALYEVTVNDMIEFLDNHHENAAVGGRGPKTFGRVDDDDSPLDIDSYLVPGTDGQVYCKLCDKHLDRRGLPKHVEGVIHSKLLNQLEEKALNA